MLEAEADLRAAPGCDISCDADRALWVYSDLYKRVLALADRAGRGTSSCASRSPEVLLVGRTPGPLATPSSAFSWVEQAARFARRARPGGRAQTRGLPQPIAIPMNADWLKGNAIKLGDAKTGGSG